MSTTLLRKGDVAFAHPVFGLPGAFQMFGKNNTGSTILKGSLGYRGGWNAPSSVGAPSGFSLFQATNLSGFQADGVFPEDIPNGGWGYLCGMWEMGGLNTSGTAVGDPVYLGAAGAITFTAPTAVGVRVQRVGAVARVDATNGAVAFDCLTMRDVNPAGEEGVKVAQVSLTNAQMLALRATPVELVAAPGAGYQLFLIGLVLEFDYGGAAYTIVNAGDDMKVRYNNAAGTVVSDNIDSAGFLDATADVVTNGRPSSDLKALATAGVNKSLVLHNIGVAEYGGGNAGNVVRATCYYIKQKVGF